MRIGYYFGVPGIAVDKHIGFLSWKSGITRSIIERLYLDEAELKRRRAIYLQRKRQEISKLVKRQIILEVLNLEFNLNIPNKNIGQQFLYVNS